MAALIYPEGFEELAQKLDRPFHPPGRDVRCIVSVSMLTEGWDCNTVTHIVGTCAAFVMSQAFSAQQGGGSWSSPIELRTWRERQDLSEEGAPRCLACPLKLCRLNRIRTGRGRLPRRGITFMQSHKRRSSKFASRGSKDTVRRFETA